MSYAPRSLQDLGAYWTSKGGVNLGIVGDTNHTTGYHLGKDRIYGPMGQGDDDYSVKLARDKAGLTNGAAALDLGKLGGTYARLYDFSRWLVAQCQSKAPGTADIREIIYSPDGSQVQRYSGVDGKIHTGPGNGDAGHRSHTHISYFRDSEARDKVDVFRAYWEDDDVGAITWRPASSGEGIGEVVIKPNRGLINLRTGKTMVPLDTSRTSFGRVQLAESIPEGGPVERQRGYLVSLEAEAHVALDDVVESFTPAAPPAPEEPTLLDSGVYRVP